jgi:hypothetical protein
MQTLSLRVALVTGLAIAGFALIAGTTFAAPGNSGDTKPGWGFGDKNHTHTGPPGGPSVHPVHSP